MLDKVTCSERDWEGMISDALTAPNPFDPEDTINGCPQCHSVDSMVVACDEPGCWKPASCGTPVAEGPYRNTCGKHVPPKHLRKPPYNELKALPRHTATGGRGLTHI